MHELFTELDILIHDGTQQVLPETEREQKRKAASLKIRELEKAFTGSFLKVQSKKALRTMVCVLEKAIHIWLEKLYRSRPTAEKRNRTNEQLEIWCTETLEFMRRHFSEHFNPYEPMPRCLWEPHQTQHEQNWTSLEAGNPELVESGLLPLLKGIYKSQLMKTGTHSYYHTEYWTDLLACLPSEQPGVYAEPVKATLVTLIRRNCNHELLVHYFMEKTAYTGEESVSEIIYWIRCLQWVERIPLIDDTGADPMMPGIKKQLTDAIQSELMLCKQYQITDGPSNAPEAPAIFQTSLSVSQLGAFFRLLTEAGILITDNNRELIRIVSKTFRTNRTPTHISEQHLYDKFYCLETPALSIVKTHLQTMLKKINNL